MSAKNSVISPKQWYHCVICTKWLSCRVFFGRRQSNRGYSVAFVFLSKFSSKRTFSQSLSYNGKRYLHQKMTSEIKFCSFSCSSRCFSFFFSIIKKNETCCKHLLFLQLYKRRENAKWNWIGLKVGWDFSRNRKFLLLQKLQAGSTCCPLPSDI